MHTPLQEAVAQGMFWGSIGSCPTSIVCFIFAFRTLSRVRALLLFVLGGALLTQGCWYFVYLGTALSDKVGGAHYPVWWQYAFLSFGVAIFLLLISELIRSCRT